MLKSWYIIDPGLIDGSTGHHYWETQALARELVSRGAPTKVLAHKSAVAQPVGSVEVVPVFSLFTHASVSQEPAWAPLENFVLHNRAFDGDISRLEQFQFHAAVVLVPNATERHLLGIFRWLSRFADESRPDTAFVVVAPRAGRDSEASLRLYRTIWAECPPRLKSRVAAFARTPATIELFREQAGMELRLFPFPFVPRASGQLDPESGPAANADTMTVTFVGGARRERGGALLPEIVARCTSLPVEFFIQAKGGSDAGFDLKLLTDLRALPKVRLHEGTLELDDYYRTIAKGIVLIPYHPQAYRWRASGVYYEAKSLGAPVIVSSGTWMAEEVKSSGNGLVFEEYSAASIAECIARAPDEIPRLRANAIRCARRFRENNGAAKCIDAINAAFKP